MPRNRKKSGRAGNRGQNSSVKNDATKSKAEEDSVDNGEKLEPITESQASIQAKAVPQEEEEEAKAVPQEEEEERGEQPEPDYKEEEQMEQSKGKPNESETGGSAKKNKKKKQKKQDDEVDKQVQDINKTETPQEKLWLKISGLCEACPEPIINFFEKLSHGNHWTFLKSFKEDEIYSFFESLKKSGPDVQIEKGALLDSERRGKSKEKTAKDISEELKNRTEEAAGLKQRFEIANKKLEEYSQNNSRLNQQLEIANKELEEYKQNISKVYQQLQCRDEQCHVLQHRYQAEAKKLETEQEKCRKIAEDRDQFKDRFSKLAETKLTAGNANIQDLSDINRPQKLGEKLSELYDNEWTDAYESLQESQDLDEKGTVLKLLEIFKTCVSFCQLKAEEQELQLMDSVRNLLEFSATEKADLCNGSLEGQEQDVLTPRDTKMFKDFLKAKGMNSLIHLKKVFLAEHPNYAGQGKPIQDFICGCLEVCWLSAIQDPPLAFDWNFPEGCDVTEKSVKPFTKSGSKVDYVVWPVMKLCVDGDILCKGVVQPIPEGKNKKKNSTQ